MSVTTATNKAGPFIGNGIQLAFPFSFSIFAAADVLVTLTSTPATGSVESTRALGADYTVVVNADQVNNPGGTVNMVVAPTGDGTTANSQLLTLSRVVTETQGTQLPQGGQYNAKIVEKALDRATILVQQLRELFNRTPSFAVSDTSSAKKLPNLATRNSTVLGFDANGDFTTYSAASGVTDSANVGYTPGFGALVGIAHTVKSFLDKLAQAGTSLGAALIGFIQTGIGAVARSAQDKMRESISLADYVTNGGLSGACTEAVARNLPLRINANFALTANLNTTARLIPDGGIITTGAFNLTVGSVDPIEIPLFDKAGTGVITISKGDSYLGWFAPTGDGVADDTNPVLRWVNSSYLRMTTLQNTFLTDTTTVPTQAAAKSKLIGAGTGVTSFKSKTGADIFQLPGVNISGLYYVNYLQMGGFSGIGQGSGVGAGYLVNVLATVSTGYNNEFLDMDSTLMGGGTFFDQVGLFSTTWKNLRGGESGDHVFRMQGSGPASVMENCYARNALAGKAGFRVIYPTLVLRGCNGLNTNTAAKSSWGIFGQSTSLITINVTFGGSFTIPAGPTQVAAAPRLQACNIEAFPDCGIICINGAPLCDDKCLFQTKANQLNCIAIYCPDNLGSGIQGTVPKSKNIVLVGTATWAQNCPVWAQSSGAILLPPPGDTLDSLAVYDITDALVLTYSALFSKYIGSARTAVGVKHLAVTGALRMDGLQASASYANDAAAATGGVGIGEFYRNGSVVQIRVA